VLVIQEIKDNFSTFLTAHINLHTKKIKLEVTLSIGFKEENTLSHCQNMKYIESFEVLHSCKGRSGLEEDF